MLKSQGAARRAAFGLIRFDTVSYGFIRPLARGYGFIRPLRGEGDFYEEIHVDYC
jgi:hypothetical protein